MTDNYKSLPGIVAGEDLSSAQYKAVYLSAANTVSQVSNANGQRPIGILQNDPISGEAADVAYEGVCKWEYGGTITFANTLACNNSGEAIADDEVTAQDGADLHHMADALESGVDGDIRKVLLHTPVLVGLE